MLKNFSKFLKPAFTIMEAFLVMIIMGIIVTLLMANLKPDKLKEESLKLLAQRTLHSIDIGLKNVILNHATNGKLTVLRYDDTTKGTFTLPVSSDDGKTEFINHLKKYISASRKPCYIGDAQQTSSYITLKSGACMVVNYTAGSVDAFYPNDTVKTTVNAPYGYIRFDLNGKEEPNALGKDQFNVILGPDGVNFSATSGG